jgi:mRNA-degrading endonuclease RelE of RelBE toxin-antitoxin system
MKSEAIPNGEIIFPFEQQRKQSIVRVDLTPEFRQNLHDLAKRYRSIRSDVQALIQELKIGNFVGDCLAGIGGSYNVFKTRVKNQDIQKGKRAGYRLIYQVESPTSVLLLTIYSKSDHEDISIKEIRNILNEFYGSV